MKIDDTNGDEDDQIEDDDEATPLQPVPPQEQTPTGQGQGTACGLAAVMVMEVFVTFAQYILLQDLPAFSHDVMGMSEDVAGAMVLIFAGVLYVVPAIAGGFADTIFGKYGSLVGVNILRLIGEIVLLILVAVPKAKIEGQQHGLVEAMLYIALVFIALSHGSYLAVSYSFGVDQLPVVNRLNIWSFFMWKKWCTSLGKTLCFYLMTVIDKRIHGDNRLFKVSLRTASIVIALLIILGAKRVFHIVEPQGAAVFRRLRRTISENVSNLLRRRSHGNRRTPSQIRDYQDRTHELRKVALLCGLSATAGIYMTIHNQGFASYPMQGKRLHNDFHISTHILNACASLVPIVLIPLFEVYNRCRGHWNTMHILVIAGFGYCFMTCSPLAAGLVETFNRRASHVGNHSNVSIMVQVPQYTFIGLADVFALIPIHEFGYLESPEHIVSFIIGLLYSVGAFVGMIVFVIQAVKVKIPSQHDIRNNGPDSYEYLFYGLAFAALMNLFILYIPISVLYRKRMERRQREVEEAATTAHHNRHQ